MVDLNKYTYNGWGLSRVALSVLEKLIKEYTLKNCIEFGSGQSTYFLNDVGIDYISFDDDIRFSAKVKNVLIRDLIQIDDIMFNSVINGNINYMDICNNFPKFTEKNTRQRNCFYKLNVDDINDKFDLIILDGPNGNGRSISFNVIKPYLKEVSFILIDDYTHYPFIDYLEASFPNLELYYSHTDSRDKFQIYRIQQ